METNNDFLRKEVIQLCNQGVLLQRKHYKEIKYKELAEFLDISQSSFGNWLHGYYDFGEQKQRDLWDLICNLKEC